MNSRLSCALGLCLLLNAVCGVGRSSLAQEPPKAPAKPAGHVVYHVVYEVELDGRLTKVVQESRDPSVGVIWMDFVLDPRIQKFLEMNAEQRAGIVAACQTDDCTFAKLEQAVRAQLLPMQLDWLGQVVHRRHAMYDGLVPWLKFKGFLAKDGATPEELERVLVICRARKKEFASATERELSLFNAEVRRTLTRKQLELISQNFGKDARMLESQGLDFVLGQMERACFEGHRGLSPVERALGVSVRLELMPTGRLESAKSGGPDDFLNSFLKLGQHPDVGLRGDQIRRNLEVQAEVMNRLSPFSVDLFAKFEAGLMTQEGAIKEVSDFFDREISKALPDLLKTLDDKQLKAIRKLALKRQLMQQGVLGVLLNDEAFAVSKAQRQEIVKIVRGKTDHYERLSIECEMKLWDEIPRALEANHRPIWEKMFGKEQFKLLPGSPTLLLQGLEEDERPLEKDEKQAAQPVP